MKLSASFWAGFIACVLSPSVFAATELDTVTVAGSGNEISLKNNPASVSVLDRKQIEQQGADSVAELLRDLPGVTVADSSAAGMKRIRMRGESSRRVTILVDGQEITDHSTFGTPILINPASIERIEVIRGPASVLYGAKAIGGVINIITRQGAEKAVALEVGGSWHSGADGRQVFVALSGAGERFDYRLSASGEEYGARRVADGPYSNNNTLDNSGFENTDLNMHLGYRLGASKNHHLMFKANQYRLSTDSWTDPHTLSGAIKEFNIQLPKRDLNKYGVYYRGAPLAGVIKKIKVDGYYQWVDRDFSNHVKVDPGVIVVEVDSTSVDRNINYGGSAQVDFNLPEKHQLIVGVQYLMDDLDTHKTTQQTVDGLVDQAGSGHRINRVHMQTLSVFSQYSWQLPADFNLSAGSRFYQVRTALDETSDVNRTNAENSWNSQLVKSLGLTYTGFTHSTLRTLYSEGYIMPTLLQMYTDTSAGRGVTTYGNPALKAETSHNIELGMRYANHGLMLDAATFYTKAEDYISSHACTPLSLCPSGAVAEEFININADSARSFGLELQLEYNLSRLMLTPYITGTWMRRELVQHDFSTYHSDTPLFAGKMGARYEHFFANSEFWFDTFVRAASAATQQEEANGPLQTLSGYATAHIALGGALGATAQYQWSLHLNNLLDKSYRASSDELPGTGRNFVASLQARF